MIRKMAMKIISAVIKVMIAAIIVVVLYWGGKKGFEFGMSIFSQTAVEEAPGRDISVTVNSGMDVMDIAKVLKKEGLIRDDMTFFILAKLYEYEPVQGSYLLNTSMTSEEIIETMKKKGD